MGLPEVGQLAALEAIFADDLREIRPRSVAVIGCATGNGFGQIDPTVTRRIVGVDLNPEYLEILRSRHATRLANLELICGDIESADLGGPDFDLIHAALIFEYVDCGRALDRIVPALRHAGRLTAVLQMPSDQAPTVSRTAVESVRALGAILKLVEPSKLIALAASRGAALIDQRRVPLPGGKSFLVLKFEA
jgi:SAM-dependent methyltransferase